MLFLQTMIPLFHSLIAFALLSILPLTSPACPRTCGKNLVPYPFGFSDECDIKLNCSSNSTGIMKIGSFDVQNFTSDQILVNLPAKCNRSIEDLSSLFQPNFSPTWRNGLLLENCRNLTNDCVIPSRLLRSKISLADCNSGAGNTDFNISCYSSESNDDAEFLDLDKVKQKGNCGFLLSSVMVETKGNASMFIPSNTVALDFQMVELGWWLPGNCSCVSEANCRTVKGKQGYDCRCKDGYVGDGFVAGEGCRKVSYCEGRGGRIFTRCGSTKVVILIIGIIAGAILMSVLAVIYYYMRKCAKTSKSRLSARRLINEAAGNFSVPFYPYKEIDRATNGFSEKQRLGTGAYGTVYSGKLHNGDRVAIKKIRYRDHESVDLVMNEIKLLSSVSHPNLVRLLGCCIEEGEQILVYEYMANGTLSQHLQHERGTVLPWTIRLTIAADTAHAIAHLHCAMNPPIYHRDIKSSNILLDFNFKSKVADFGLCRFGMTDDSHISTAPQGTPGYLDPQYHQNFHLSDKSDVYSFGVVLVEIITAMRVVDFSRPHSEINLAALAIDRIGKGLVDDIIDPFLEPNRDAWTLSSIYKVAELAFRCLAFHRDMRPSMMEVADELEQIRLSSWAPLDENMCMGSSVASSCSSPRKDSEKSFNISISKRLTAVESRRVVVVPHRGGGAASPIAEEVKDHSPVSVQDPWLSEQNSPSTSSLLGNLVR